MGEGSRWWAGLDPQHSHASWSNSPLPPHSSCASPCSRMGCLPPLQASALTSSIFLKDSQYVTLNLSTRGKHNTQFNFVNFWNHDRVMGGSMAVHKWNPFSLHWYMSSSLNIYMIWSIEYFCPHLAEIVIVMQWRCMRSLSSTSLSKGNNVSLAAQSATTSRWRGFFAYVIALLIQGSIRMARKHVYIPPPIQTCMHWSKHILRFR